MYVDHGTGSTFLAAHQISSTPEVLNREIAEQTVLDPRDQAQFRAQGVAPALFRPLIERIRAEVDPHTIANCHQVSDRPATFPR